MMMPTSPLKELFNLRCYIQYFTDECESDDDDDDDDDLDNPYMKTTGCVKPEENS